VFPRRTLMNRLQSYSRSIKEVFEGTLTVRHMASALASFDAERSASEVHAWTTRKDFDQIGVRRNGLVAGYALRRRLHDGVLEDYFVPFADNDVVSGEMPLIEALQLVAARGVVYVNVLNEVNGIVAAGDVGRPPVRLWLFGLITISEMQLTRLIKARYPDDSWTDLLTEKRLKQVRWILKQRKKNQTEVSLTDCLILDNKQRIAARSPQLRDILQLASEDDAAKRFARIVDLRNDLAHANDITAKWPQFLADAQWLESLIEIAERISSRDIRALEPQ
jgi:hypothetical protein